jgi:hypothetical protein
MTAHSLVLGIPLWAPGPTTFAIHGISVAVITTIKKDSVWIVSVHVEVSPRVMLCFVIHAPELFDGLTEEYPALAQGSFCE